MITKKAIIHINYNNISLVVLETKDNLYYNVIDIFSDTIPLVEDIEQNGIVRPVLIKELLKILKMYRRICDNNSITEIATFTGNYFSNAKNNKSIIEEVYNTCGFSIVILTPEEELRNTFIGAVNASDVPKGIYFYVGENSSYLVQFNRRNMLASCIIPLGICECAKILEGSETLEEKIQTISSAFKQHFDNIDFVQNLDEEVEFMTSGNLMLSIGKIARKATRYPLDLENNYVLTSENFDKVFSLIETVGVDKTKKIKGISSESADRIFAGAILTNLFIKNLKINRLSISSDSILDGFIATTVLPEIIEKPLSDMFIYSLENISSFLSNSNSNNCKVYELCINVFKQLKVIHKLPRPYIKPMRIAGYLYDCGKRINFDNYVKNSFEVILNSKIKGVSQKEILLAAFACKLQDLDNFNLADWVKYSSIVSEEDSDAVKKIGVLVQLAASLDASKSGAVDDLTCDILGDSIIMKTIVNKDADFEIKEAMKVNSNFKKVFTKFIEVI
ncbi:MAG: hypothetical protein MR423_02755 [Firmicutes bacterium]|nr:hypothetical protein [Bacillota bacterium]MDY3659021.1 hypothetical protein [Eubacteriales bacterium]